MTAVVMRHRDQPFDYAGSNCVTLMIDAVEALTGERPFDHHIAGVRTAAGYRKRLSRAAAGGNLADFLALHFRPVPPSFAQRGDLCIIQRDGIEHGAVMLDDVAVGKSERGLMRCDRAMITKAFRVA